MAKAQFCMATAKAGTDTWNIEANSTIRFIRYPGGKQRLLRYILPHLPRAEEIQGRYIEPFLGGASVFFALNPDSAVLSDLNSELIELYQGIQKQPAEVWTIFKSFPNTKKGYYQVRSLVPKKDDLALKAARTLYLNRTCFKGMWRHNATGEFNVGYGGQDRRWVLDKQSLLDVSIRLRKAILTCRDYSKVLESANRGDFIFADPPYCPGESELYHSHYTYGRFTFEDHEKLANTLSQASENGTRWAMTTSSHPTILGLFKRFYIIPLSVGTGKRPGILTRTPGEVLIRNYQ